MPTRASGTIRLCLQSWNKAYKNSAKTIEEFMVRPRGRRRSPPLHEYANDPLGIIISVNTAETYPQFTIFLHNFQKFRMMMIDDPRLPSQEEMIPYHGSSNTQSCTGGGALPSVATGWHITVC